MRLLVAPKGPGPRIAPGARWSMRDAIAVILEAKLLKVIGMCGTLAEARSRLIRLGKAMEQYPDLASLLEVGYILAHFAHIKRNTLLHEKRRLT